MLINQSNSPVMSSETTLHRTGLKKTGLKVSGCRDGFLTHNPEVLGPRGEDKSNTGTGVRIQAPPLKKKSIVSHGLLWWQYETITRAPLF